MKAETKRKTGARRQPTAGRGEALTRDQTIWAAVRRIPRGLVATYGQVAEMAGLEGHARQAGYALHNLPEGSTVPWHRVINAKGEISPRSSGDSHELQRMLLTAEGVSIDDRGRIDLKRFLWSVQSPHGKRRPQRP